MVNFDFWQSPCYDEHLYRVQETAVKRNKSHAFSWLLIIFYVIFVIPRDEEYPIYF